MLKQKVAPFWAPEVQLVILKLNLDNLFIKLQITSSQLSSARKRFLNDSEIEEWIKKIKLNSI